MRILLIFLPAYLMSQFFRSFLAVIAPDLQSQLALSEADLGAISGAWFVAFAFAQFPVGWALDRIGPRRSVPSIMLLAVSGCILLANAESRRDCEIAMYLIGAGCAPMYMGALYTFARLEAPERFATLSSWLIGFGSLGNVLAAAPLAILAASIGWRDAFVAIGIVTLLAAIIVAVLARDPQRVDDDRAESLFRSLWRIVTMRSIWPLLPLAGISYAVVAAERGLWIGPYLKAVYGADSLTIGNWSTIMAFTMIAGAMAYGPADRLFGSRKWVALTGSLLTGALFLMLGLIPNLRIEVASAILGAIGFFGLTYAVIMAHGRAFFPDHLIGRGITFLNFLFIGGAAVLQPVSGWFVTWRLDTGAPPANVYGQLHIAFGLALLTAAAIYMLSRDRPPTTSA